MRLLQSPSIVHVAASLEWCGLTGPRRAFPQSVMLRRNRGVRLCVPVWQWLASPQSSGGSGWVDHEISNLERPRPEVMGRAADPSAAYGKL
jgi:hypothetical protein